MNDALTELAQAVEQIRLWKLEQQTIVFTNGCFDLLHPGHINYLEKARALGDRLIIGLNDDHSIRRLKGDNRPINPLSERATMLAALRAVDMVIPFSEDTPLKLICALKPDILVKGGDYHADAIVGAREVRQYGGRVVIMPFIEGHSTTALIQRIMQLHHNRD